MFDSKHMFSQQHNLHGAHAVVTRHGRAAKASDKASYAACPQLEGCPDTDPVSAAYKHPRCLPRHVGRWSDLA